MLVVDDSALIRKLLTDILSGDPALEVVGSAPDPIAAWDKIQTLRPDVLTLDVEMPKMDGLSFLERLMRAYPMPVVMVSTLTEKGCETTLRALELGAVDFVTKPKLDVQRGTLELGQVLIEKVKMAARARIRQRHRSKPSESSPATRVSAVGSGHFGHQVIAIGASTGGTEALREVLTALPANAPPVLVVQHMPEKFTGPFARRLDAACQVRVREAAPGDALTPGEVLIAPGNQHMLIRPSARGPVIELNSDPPVRHHRPAVDVLFHSCAKELRARAVGVILTGMGADGALGLLAMRNAGARTVAQDAATCVVFGMPAEAIAIGGAEMVAPLENIAAIVLGLCSR